jgi:hypothetical protein
MPTDPISSSSSIIETMRALARDRAGGATRNDKAAPANTATSGKEAGLTPAKRSKALRQRVSALAAGVDTNNPVSLASAREPVLREILLWEFGSDFRKDSQFLPMIDTIVKAMDADPGFQQRFAELIRVLKS